MTPAASFWIRAGAAFAFLAVCAGAFGAHWLRGQLKPPGDTSSKALPDTKGSQSRPLVPAERRLEVFNTGVHYHFLHALALIALGLILAHDAHPSLWAAVAGWTFVLGIVLFSGSLYALGFTGIGWLGAITPLGGLAFLVGWIALILLASPARP